MRIKPQKPRPKMMQINVIDTNGKLTINVKKKGFSPIEAIGVLEIAKNQIRNHMGMKPGFSTKSKDKK